MTDMLYPLIFHPIFKQHPWGGRRIERLFKKPLPPDILVGESWEISDRAEAASVIANGPLAGRDLHWLIENHCDELLGLAETRNGRFPLLVKILDATQAPSVQVHPSAAVARKLGGEPKTELWYVAYAEPGALLYAGLRLGIRHLQFVRSIEEGSVMDCLHTVPVKAGDAMLVPAGRVHTIGPGNVIFEIQENSDTTYRIYDWNRPGPDGKPRQLHIEQAIEAIDFEDFEPGLVPADFTEQEHGRTRMLADTDPFTIEEKQTSTSFPMDFRQADRPTILAVVSGLVRVRHAASGTDIALGPGQFCLVPASATDTNLQADAQSTFLIAQPAVKSASAPGAASQSERQIVPPWQVYESRRRMQSELAGPAPKWSWDRVKHRLARRLVYSPFLRMLLLKFWFRMAVLAFFMAMLALAILLPPVWRSTPPGFMPVVKVSLLDKIQARTLRRTAERATAAGNYRAAAEAWRAALGNDMGSAELTRGFIRNTLAQDQPDKADLRSALYLVPWLLRLTGTNHADLELSVQLLDKFQVYNQVYELLAPMTNALTPTLQLALTKAAFFENRIEEFLEYWQKLTPQQKENPEAALCYAAYLTTWGPEGTSLEGRNRLLAAAEGPQPLRNLANRLLLIISSSKRDIATFEAAFRRLEEAKATTAVNHAAYWTLLASVGRKDEAIKLARDYAYPPRTAREVARVATAYAALGLNTEAQNYLKRYATALGAREDIWQVYGAVALAGEDWERLRAVALQMRSIPALESRLRSLSYYYEGRADHATGRNAAALLAFQKAAESDFPSPSFADTVARTLISLGYPGPARTILEKVEENFASKPDYWETMVSLAIMLKDEQLLLKASREALRLAPTNPVLANRYAAALIIVGNRPAEAVTLTTRLYNELPGAIATQINHSLALLMNRRADEAEALLDRIIPGKLDPEELNSYRVARFHLAVQKGRFDEAKQLLAQIETVRMFPSEQRWLEEARKQIPETNQRDAAATK